MGIEGLNGAAETAEALHENRVDETCAGLRLDVYLAAVVEDASRSFLKKLIQEKRVRVNGEVCTKPARTVREHDAIAVLIPPPPPFVPEAENIPLDILFEDADVLVVNKPSGLVVHPAPGHFTGTLVNAVLYHCRGLHDSGDDPQRPGIVHRLDKDTSGVMVVAKTPRAFQHLAKQAAAHDFERRYLALVAGSFKESRGRIEAGIGRSLKDPGRMAVTSVRARHAVTHFEVLEDFRQASYIGLQLDTGRTHQIRVHLRYAGRPVLGDPLYGITDFRNWRLSAEALEALASLQGQALHAERLGFQHPVSGERVHFSTSPPEDFRRALEALRESVREG